MEEQLSLWPPCGRGRDTAQWIGFTRSTKIGTDMYKSTHIGRKISKFIPKSHKSCGITSSFGFLVAKLVDTPHFDFFVIISQSFVPETITISLFYKISGLSNMIPVKFYVHFGVNLLIIRPICVLLLMSVPILVFDGAKPIHWAVSQPLPHRGHKLNRSSTSCSA